MCTATLHVVHISLAWAASNEVLHVETLAEKHKLGELSDADMVKALEEQHVAKYMYNVISSLQCLTTGNCRCADSVVVFSCMPRHRHRLCTLERQGSPWETGSMTGGPRHFENCTLEWPRRVIPPGALCKNNGQRLQHCLIYLLPKVASYRSTSLIRSTDCSVDCRGCYERLKTGRDRNSAQCDGALKSVCKRCCAADKTADRYEG